MKYINNLTSGKIELHFSKSDYLNMPEELKAELKRYFLFSGKLSAWVSRSVNNHYWAVKTANKLGFDTEVKEGERLSYAEQLEVKAEKAEERAERYEQYSENAEKRAERLQSDLNSMRGDIAFFTQPIIAGHSGSQAFARYREKMYARYDRGFEEYRKSTYYLDRAATARATASNVKLGDKVYLINKIKEQNKEIKTYQGIIVKYEEALFKVQNGEVLKNRSNEILTEEYIEQRIAEMLEKYEWHQDKLNFLEDCLSKLGGVQFSKDNIKVGYVVDMRQWGKCEIVSVGPLNVKYKILTGGAKGFGGTEPYAAIENIISIKAPETI